MSLGGVSFVHWIASMVTHGSLGFILGESVAAELFHLSNKGVSKLGA